MISPRLIRMAVALAAMGIAREVRKTNLKLLATFHHARTYGSHFKWAKPYTDEERKTLDIFAPD